jgi:spore maturation protein CgeB
MNIILNYRHKNERLEESLQAIGCSIVYNVWDIDQINEIGAHAVIFEFKQILKEELRFLRMSYKLKRSAIPIVTWCLDLPNIGSRQWKLSLLLKTRLIDIFATHSLQGLQNVPGIKSTLLYLPNAAWTSRYNLGNVSMEDLRDTGRYNVDVSFLGNIDSRKHPEHRHRAEFLNALSALLQQKNIIHRFEDSRYIDFKSQIELIQKSRININFGCAADRPENSSWGLPERCYGIPACGGFLLSDERVHARDDFAEGDEIVMFGDLHDCLQKIIYYRELHDERRRIAENAFNRINKEHTYVHRAKKLMAAINEFHVAKS